MALNPLPKIGKWCIILIHTWMSPESSAFLQIYLRMLEEKLDEELEEYHQDQNLEELADLLEVLLATAEARGYTVAELELMRKKKAAERGGFAKKIMLKEVSDPADPCLLS